MDMQGEEVPSEIHVKKQVSEDTAANVEENPETESSEHSNNDGNEEQKGQNQGPESSETEAKNEEIEEQSSPRGVLEIPISGSDSDNGSTMDRSSSFGREKTSGVLVELSYGNLHWKKLFNQIKKGSLKKFPTISLLGGHGYGFGFDLTRKKMMRKKIGRKSSQEDAIDCGDIVMPKPSWRNFSFEELKQATDNFSPDKLIGKGGHAEVYKGCLSEGQVVAVKKIIKEKKKDEERVGDFLSELGIIAHIDHTNAAKLVGFSADNGLHLVLQFSPHGSLATVLHGDPLG